MTATIQPPLLAWAWRLAMERPSVTPAIVKRLYDERRGLVHQIVRQHSHELRVDHQLVTRAAPAPLALPDLP